MKTIAFEWILRGLLLLSALLILSDPAKKILQKIRMRNRLRERKRIEKGKADWERKLDEAVLVVFGPDMTSGLLMLFDLTVFVTSFAVASRTLRLPVAFLTGIVLAGLPWIYLYVRLETKRRKGSREGITLVAELLRRYRIAGKNLPLAIEETVSVPELRVTGRLLYRLLLSLRDAKNGETIRKAADDFAYGLGTNWGRMLSYNIANAAETGRDIGPGLEDILIQLRDAEKLAEERKRMNGETARIVNLFLPFLYPASLLMMHRAMDMPWETILRNQFQTSEGVLLLLAALVLWALNVLLLSLVTGRKFDF